MRLGLPPDQLDIQSRFRAVPHDGRKFLRGLMLGIFVHGILSSSIETMGSSPPGATGKLALDQGRRHPKPDKDCMAHVVFVCPATDRNVHHWLDADDEKRPLSEDKYDAVSCPACAKLHFVNRKTGKLLGYEK